MGRHPKPEDRRVDWQTSVRFSQQERAALERAAEDRHCTLGAVVRWAVREALCSPTADRAKNFKVAPDGLQQSVGGGMGELP